MCIMNETLKSVAIEKNACSSRTPHIKKPYLQICPYYIVYLMFVTPLSILHYRNKWMHYRIMEIRERVLW